MVPWHVARSSDCPESRPWATINDDTGAVEGCHATEADAKRQQAALYANEPQARAMIENTIEVRSYKLQEFELKGNIFEGYAAVYDQPADLGAFTEEVRRGAVRKSLAEGYDIPFVWNHDGDDIPFATTESRTLKLGDEPKGMQVWAELDQRHHKFHSLASAVERGIVKGMSFGFIAGHGNSTTENRGGKLHRVLTGFKRITDVSATHMPAYQGTSAELRNRARWLAGGLNEWELALLGAYHQLEARSIVDPQEDVTDPPAPEAPAVEPVPEVPVDPERGIDGEPQPAGPTEPDQPVQDETPSGVDAFDEEAFAARSRRLAELGLDDLEYRL